MGVLGFHEVLLFFSLASRVVTNVLKRQLRNLGVISLSWTGWGAQWAREGLPCRRTSDKPENGT